MKRCLECNQLCFWDRNLICNYSGEVIVNSEEDMDILKSKKCTVEKLSTGRVGGAHHMRDGSLYCLRFIAECNNAGECNKLCVLRDDFQ